MLIPRNVIANADDFGYSPSVNKAILYCFEQGYINSASLMTNMGAFDEAITLINQNKALINIGVHVDLAEGRPLTNIPLAFLEPEGNFDVTKTNRASNQLSPADKQAFSKEINAQIERAISNKVRVGHLDSHLHIHTLPAFHKLFLAAAKAYKLKLRIAQTYNEGNYLKFYYRKYINYLFRKNGCNYSDRFETVDRFLIYKNQLNKTENVEVMLHPWFNDAGQMEDHYDRDTMVKWINFLNNK